MHLIKTSIILAAVLTTLTAHSSEVKKMKKWFNNPTCEKMHVVQYKSAADHSAVREIKVADSDFIQSFQTQIRQLPVEGDMMIKMGPEAQHLVIEFECAGKSEVIEFYNGKIKKS